MYRLLYAIVLSMSGLLWACERDIFIDIKPETPRLAIYSMIHPDSLVTVWVSHAKSVLDTTRIRAITDAEVIVSSDRGTSQVLTLANSEQGKYRADFAPRPGEMYYLSVTATGYPRAEATTQVPLPVQIEKVRYAVVPAHKASSCGESADCADTVTRYAIALTFRDPASEKNYYEVSSDLNYFGQQVVYDSLAEDWTLVWDTLTTIAYNHSFDPVIDDIGVLIEDQQFQGYRDYWFSDQLFEGGRYTFDYLAETDEAYPIDMVIALRTYHEEAYHYERTSSQQDYYDELFYEPVPLRQNIVGGYGIFGSYSQDTVVVALD